MTSKGQITIPIEVRKKLGLKTGDKINIFDNGDGKFTFQPKTGSIMDMEGILEKLGYAPLSYAPSVDEIDEAIGEHVSQMDRQTMSNYTGSQSDDKVA